MHGCSNRRMDSKEGSKRNNCTALEIVLALSLHSIPLLVVGCIGRRKIPPHHHSRHISRVRDQVEERCWSWTPKYVRLTHIVPCPASSPVCIHEVLDLQLSLLPFPLFRTQSRALHNKSGPPSAALPPLLRP